MIDDEYRWPQKGDNPFPVKPAEPDSPTWATLDWLASMNVDDSFVAGAFKEAGDMVVEQLSRGETFQHADKFFMPIGFLYRHSLELKMKEVVRLGIQLGLVPDNNKTEKVLADHNLHQIWNLVKKAVSGNWPDNSENDTGPAERIVLEFHRIDQSGQGLRYSKDRSGRSTLNSLPKSAELTHVRDVFQAIFNFLDGCEAGLSHAVEMRNDMLSYYGDGNFS